MKGLRLTGTTTGGEEGRSMPSTCVPVSLTLGLGALTITKTPTVRPIKKSNIMFS